MAINKAVLDQAAAARKKYRSDTPVSLYSIEGEDAVFIAAYLEATQQPDANAGDAPSGNDGGGTGTTAQATSASVVSTSPAPAPDQPVDCIEAFEKWAIGRPAIAVFHSDSRSNARYVWQEAWNAAKATMRESVDPDITKCPGCGGDADNGHDRCLPPNPYYCTKCSGES